MIGPRHQHASPPRPLIAREEDIQRLQSLLLDEGARLVTLVGPGGVGKTRLALAVFDRVAEQFSGSGPGSGSGSGPDGAAIVDLAPLRDAALVLPAIAHALSVPDSAPEGLAASLQAAIGARRLLLLLDNFEQVTRAAPAVAALLSACPGLHVLVTSREPLALGWEQLFEVEPLACPARDVADWEVLAKAPAVALFAQQARSVRPYFAVTQDNAQVVADICRRLDGLPLAVELAAARTRLLSPEAMLLQLQKRPLALLTGGARDAPTRHRTLREAIAWSYELLDPGQQALFRQLSVFSGGCTLSGIEAIATSPDPATDLESLLDKHLVSVSRVAQVTDEPRYEQLETVREFATERLLEAGELELSRARHAEYVLGLVEDLAPGLYGAGQSASAARLMAEHNNIRAALDWCAASDAAGSDRIDMGLRLAAALWLFWRLRGLVHEGRTRLQTLLGAAGDAPASVGLARALYAAGYLAFAQGAATDAHRLLTASLQVAREVDDPWTESYALHGLGHAALLRGDVLNARALYEQRLELASTQHDEYALGQVLNALGEVARCLDEPSVARPYYERSLQLRRKVGDTRGIAMGLANLSHVLLAEGDASAACAALAESLALLSELGHEYGQAVCVTALAAMAVADGEAHRAARLLGAVSAALDRLGNSLEPPDRRAYDRTRARAREMLGAEFDVDFGLGMSTSLSEAARLPSRPSAPTAPPPAADLDTLTSREREVVALIARGYTSDEIAQALVMTPRTADTHAAHIRAKLGLRSRAQIAAWGIQHGLA